MVRCISCLASAENAPAPEIKIDATQRSVVFMCERQFDKVACPSFPCMQHAVRSSQCGQFLRDCLAKIWPTRGEGLLGHSDSKGPLQYLLQASQDTTDVKVAARTFQESVSIPLQPRMRKAYSQVPPHEAYKSIG